MNSCLFLASCAVQEVSKGRGEERFWSGVGMSWELHNSRGPLRKKGSVCEARCCSLGSLTDWTCCWPFGYLPLQLWTLFMGRFNKVRKLNWKQIPKSKPQIACLPGAQLPHFRSSMKLVSPHPRPWDVKASWQAESHYEGCRFERTNDD